MSAPVQHPVDVREALAHFASGVAVITTRTAAGDPVGTTVSAVSSLSLDPPLVLVCLNRASGTLAALRERSAFAINVLSSGQQALSWHFAKRGPAAAWDAIAHAGEGTGSPHLDGALAVLDCEVQELLPGGDHDIVLGRPVALSATEEEMPLLHFRGSYRALAG